MPTIALILAAGQGTRMKSKTPKVIHKILGIPLVEFVIDAAQEAQCEDIVVITGHQAEEVEAVLPARVHAVRQAQRIGTANAVGVSKKIVEKLAGRSLMADSTDPDNGILVVLSGDVPLLNAQTIEELIKHCKKTHSAMTVLTAILPDSNGYGRIVRNEAGDVERIVEDKDASEKERSIKEINTGIYCFALDNLYDRLDRIDNDNAQGEYYLTDILALLLADGERVTALPVKEPAEVGGVNTRVQLAQATALMQERINTRLMTAGVTMVSPATTWISPRAVIAADTEILPNTHILGASSIGEDCIIGPDTRIIDSTVEKGARIDSSIILASTVGEAANIGPRAYLRPGCVLEADTKVGTSVELKATHLGRGSKIPHLSYVGDADIGENCNLGAGTITCNYDGYTKSKTIIGDNVFIGSDTMLIAPVTIGDGATIGASSAITKDVPENALALERNEQKIIKDWAARRRLKKNMREEAKQ
ncbi:MAG: bifunctional UDP-N-acetylglucosamine diphosphorylase/glucosamine-1-phosphate N-acetyltransferase GlmU [Coriobacteriia bacterium]|nr:bifunctional UDP-N-acetylglucosamine diphosphorylase/glucosamine-1-phosphate N-acetyltransferase GlmU [Coriobacteriia bacterium]